MEQQLKEAEEATEKALCLSEHRRLCARNISQVAEGKALTPEQVVQAREDGNGKRKAENEREE